MKKFKTAFLSLMSFAIAFTCLAAPIHAQENNDEHGRYTPPIVETTNQIKPRESDWPDYNYGNWKDVAAHPEKYSKVTKCVADELSDLGIEASLNVVLQQIAKGIAWKYYGILAAYKLGKCLLVA